MVLEIRLALYCPAHPSDYIGCVSEPAQHHVGTDCFVSYVAFAPNHKVWVTEHISNHGVNRGVTVGFFFLFPFLISDEFVTVACRDTKFVILMNDNKALLWTSALLPVRFLSAAFTAPGKNDEIITLGGCFLFM